MLVYTDASDALCAMLVHEMAFFASLQFLWHFKGRDALQSNQLWNLPNGSCTQRENNDIEEKEGESEHQFIQWSLNSTTTAHTAQQTHDRTAAATVKEREKIPLM